MMSGFNESVKKELIDRAELYHNGSEDSNYLDQLFQLELLPDFIIDGLNLNGRVNNIRYLKPSLSLLEASLKKLAKKNNFGDILEIATDCNKPGLLGKQLSECSHETRLLLAAHSQTPRVILQGLLYDIEAQIRTIAAQSLAQTSEGVGHLIAYYAKTSPPVIRAIILLHSQTSPSLLSTIIENVKYSNSWLVKYAIAQHPNTPISVLKTLAIDPHPQVQEVAKLQLQGYSKSSIIPA
ncbi:hypothetical protein [Planktothrix mougeotii]|uniref:HEAT repeat domain-containing protein n=1 Tax=Planktothrix mougeotii LEGE 06226 TaxID=1828728 RepID=A0ABR9UDY4_9CYAN|nr:hypothetical protein [Planktothrix mougeotii]MBE9144643.1 hypothetical protein [Planktothrix mougeotii LEGE 06226]